MLIEIRTMRPDEAEAISALAREVWQQTYAAIITQAQIDYMLAQRYDPDRLRQELASGAAEWDVALADGERAGFASAFLTDRGETKLDKLYVRPDLQRAGIGGRLLAHVAQRARARGCGTLVLAVNKRNERAIGAYRKHGFTIRESVRVDIGQGFVMDDYVMEKKL